MFRHVSILLSLLFFLLAGVSRASGNLQNTTTDAKGNTTSHTWNSLGKPVTTTVPALSTGNNVLTTGYDSRDWATTVTNSLSHTVTTGYDAAHRPTAVIDPLTRRTESTMKP